MRRYNQRIYRVARAIVRDDAEAEDVMQQAYVNAYTHLDQFAGRAKSSTWLSRIATYEAYARVRRRGHSMEADTMRKPESPPALAASDEIDPERQAYGAELRRALEGAGDLSLRLRSPRRRGALDGGSSGMPDRER